MTRGGPHGLPGSPLVAASVIVLPKRPGAEATPWRGARSSPDHRLLMGRGYDCRGDPTQADSDYRSHWSTRAPKEMPCTGTYAAAVPPRGPRCGGFGEGTGSTHATPRRDCSGASKGGRSSGGRFPYHRIRPREHIEYTRPQARRGVRRWRRGMVRLVLLATVRWYWVQSGLGEVEGWSVGHQVSPLKGCMACGHEWVTTAGQVIEGQQHDRRAGCGSRPTRRAASAFRGCRFPNDVIARAVRWLLA